MNQQQGGNPHNPINSCAVWSQTSPEIDKDRNMLVSVNTNSRKIREYIKQHDIGSSLSASQSEKPKKKPEQVNLDKVFEAFNFNA